MLRLRVIWQTDTVPWPAVYEAMPDPQSRIKRYQARAEECLAIAEKLGDPHLRTQYMKVAESYLKLVEIELKSLSGHHPRTN